MNKFRELYQVKQLPVFQNVVYSTKDEALNCVKGDINLIQNMETGLIYNRDYDPSILEYGIDYQNEQACSSVFCAHLEEVTEIIKKYFDGLHLMEIGCGKGHFLESLQINGYSIIGFDPAYEGNNPNIFKKTFEKCEKVSTDGIILRHVLEHIPDPYHFLTKIKKVNRGTGKIYIEVPSFEWICLHRTWFDIYYEHVNYFSKRDFERMFGSIYESGYLFKGQYIYVVADLESLREPIFIDEPIIEFPDDFLSYISRFTKERRETKSVIWGGSSKGVIFSLLLQRSGINFEYVIDINQKKQGKYLPGSGLQVYSPDKGLAFLRPQDKIFIMNSNYLDEIISQSENQFKYILVENASI